MRALVYSNPGVLKVLEVPEPVARGGQAMLTVVLAGVGGSEVLALANPGIRKLPLIMGHGMVGTDPDGRRVAVDPLSGCGQCPHCLAGAAQRCADWRLLGVHHDGGFAERVAVPAGAMVPIPPELSWEQAVFIEPFANAVRAWDRGAGTSSDRVGVIGAGSLGLGCVAAAAQAGVREIGCADRSANRLAAAGRLGAAKAGAGSALEGSYDLVFDTVGSRESRAAAIEHTAPGGRTVFLGFEDAEPGFNAITFARAERTLIGSFVYDEAQFRRAMPLARATDPAWVTTFELEEAGSVLRGFAQGDYAIVKAAVRP